MRTHYVTECTRISWNVVEGSDGKEISFHRLKFRNSCIRHCFFSLSITEIIIIIPEYKKWIACVPCVPQSGHLADTLIGKFCF